MADDYREDLRVQIREAYGRVVYTYTAHLKYMNRLVRMNRVIKYTQIGLSAVSTGGIFGTIVVDKVIVKCVAALFSTALLAVNLFFKDYNLSDEIKKHQVASDNLWYIREEYISLLTDIDVLPVDEMTLKRKKLQDKTFDIYCRSPKTDAKSYSLAQQALKKEEEQFFTSEEIDRMLPEHLRIGK